MTRILAIMFSFAICLAVCRSEEVPAAQLSSKQLFDTPSLNEARKHSSALDKLLDYLERSMIEPMDGTVVSISCQEFTSDDGARYQMPPKPAIVGTGDMSSKDGRFIRINEVFTGNSERSIKGRRTIVATFLISVDYKTAEGRGILLVPFWAVLDRSEAKAPQIELWGVDDDKISHVQQ